MGNRQSNPPPTTTISKTITEIEKKKAPITAQNEKLAFTGFGSDWVFITSLGKGAFGQVYKAKELTTGDLYAIKVVNFVEAEKATALREVESAKKIDSPSVVKVYDHMILDKDPATGLSSEKEQYLIIKMELCSGNLNDVLIQLEQSNQTLSMDIVFIWFFKMLDVLHDLEKNKLIHRDLKPSNIMIKYNNNLTSELDRLEIKVGDFGLAKQINTTYSNVGTSIYKAIEIIEHEVYDQRADVYALGMILLQVCLLVPEKVLLQKQLDIVAKYQSGSFESALWAIVQNNKQLSSYFNDLLKDVSDPGAKELIEQMICVLENRLFASQLQNHPIVKTWKRVLGYGRGHREIDLLEFNNAPNGINQVMLGLLSSIKSISKPSVVLRSLYVLDKICSDETKLKERAEYFINKGGLEIVIEYINSLISQLIPKSSNTSSSKSKQQNEELEKLKTQAISSLISTNASVNDKTSTGWNMSIKLISTLLSNSDRLNSEKLRYLSTSLRRSGLFELFAAIQKFDNSESLAISALEPMIKIINFMCKHNVSTRSSYATPNFVHAILSLVAVKGMTSLTKEVVEIAALVSPYVSDEGEKHKIFSGPLAPKFIELAMSMAEPSCLLTNQSAFQKAIFARGDDIIDDLDYTNDDPTFYLETKLASLVSDYTNIQSKSYYGLCSNIDGSDTHIKTWWFRCNTCFKDDPNLGCCTTCAYQCHFGHDLSLQYSVGGYYCFCHLAEENYPDQYCNCRSSKATLLPHLYSFRNLSGFITEEPSSLCVNSSERDSEFTIFNLIGQPNTIVSKEPITTLNKEATNEPEETIGYFSVKIVASEYDDIQIGLCTSTGPITKVDQVKTNVLYNLSNGMLSIGEESFVYGPEGSVGSTIGFGVTNHGRVFVMFDNLALPLITHHTLNDGMIHAFLKTNGQTTLKFYDGIAPEIGHVPQTISHKVAPIKKKCLQHTDEVTTSCNSCDHSTEGEKCKHSSTSSSPLELSSTKSSGTASTTNNSPLSSSSSLTDSKKSSSSEKKIRVRRYGKEKGGVIITLNQNSYDHNSIIGQLRTKLKEALIVSIRDREEDYLEIDNYDDFINEKVYFAMTEEEEEKEGL